MRVEGLMESYDTEYGDPGFVVPGLPRNGEPGIHKLIVDWIGDTR
jgi:hypothetical protein